MTRVLLTALIAIGCIETAQAQNFSVSAKPIVSIGEVDGDSAYLLSQVAHVRRLRDRRIVVSMGPHLRFYDSEGKFISKAGGRGRGPGEFQYIQDLVVLPGDSLLVLHFRDRVWLNPQGKYVRQETMDLSPLSSDGFFSEGAVLLPSGGLLATQYAAEIPNDPKRKELHRPQVRYSLYDPAARKVQPLVMSGGLRQMTIGERNSVVQPFTPHAQHAVGADRIYVGDNDTTVLSVFSLNGKKLGTIKVASEAVPITAKDLADYRQSMLDRMTGERAAQRTSFEQGWTVVPKPKRHPYFSSALVDALGHLWVSAPYRPNTATRTWTVFDQGGRRLAAVSLPARFQIKEVGTDYVLGVARDEFDVEYVHMYSLSRGARPPRGLFH